MGDLFTELDNGEKKWPWDIVHGAVSALKCAAHSFVSVVWSASA